MARRVSIPTTFRASTEHKVDVMVAEQKKLVENAQEGLQQSISLLQNAIMSKEECDSEHLQVLSLLSRTEELMVTLQVINELRMEICHVLKDITYEKKKDHDTGLLQKRLQWLEQRLEKLTLSKKRGRPGIRNRGKQLHHKETVRPFQFHHGLCPSQNPSRLPNRLIVKSVTDSEVTNSGDCTISPSMRDSTVASPVHREHGLIPLVPRATPQTRLLSLSSKQSPIQDSDVWYSESEANWTMVENPLKDITQSQVLSEDESKVCEGESHQLSSASHAGGAVHESSGKDVTSNYLPKLYGFEHPRSIDVFGVCSWNSLHLAINSNILQETNDSCDRSVTERVGHAVKMLNVGLSGICEEIDSLNKLIQAAAVAATKSGLLLCVDNSISRAGSSVMQRYSTKLKAGHCVNQDEPNILKMPSPNDPKPHLDVLCSTVHACTSCKTSKSRSYPRSSDEWHSQANNLLSSTNESRARRGQLKVEAGKDEEMSRTSYRSLPSKLSQSGASRHTPHSQFTADKDTFYEVKHCEQHIEHLVNLLDSASMETRKDSLLVIRTLPKWIVSKAVMDKIHGKFMKDADTTVRYEAMKCLVSHGIADDLVIQAICCCLMQGSHSLQLELLQFLNQDNIVEILTQPHLDGCLCEALTSLLSIEDSAISFEAAVVLVKLGFVQDFCCRRLYQALHDPSPKIQNLALMCLVNNCSCYGDEIISAAIKQMHKLADWKLRLNAVEALKKVGHSLVTWKGPSRDVSFFKLLLQRLFDEPVVNVRVAIGRLITFLKLHRRAESTLLLNLENPDPRIRAQAVIALAALDWRNPKVIHLLLDCLELDPSIFVRVKVARALGQMEGFNVLVLKRLREKSRGSGILAQECQAAWQHLLQKKAQ